MQKVTYDILTIKMLRSGVLLLQTVAIKKINK